MKDSDKIALKSGYYFITCSKNDITFFNQLQKTNKQIMFKNEKFDIYEAPTWEVAKMVDSYMDKFGLGNSLDDYPTINI